MIINVPSCNNFIVFSKMITSNVSITEKYKKNYIAP